MPPNHLTVVMPAYQLADEIEANIRRVLRSLEPIGSHEVVAVDDGSTDGTGEILNRLAVEEPHLRIVRHERNRGKGQALITGWEESTGDRIVFLDADLDLPPEQIPTLLETLEGADVVVGTKRDAMSRRDYPPLRSFLSRLYSMLTGGLFRLPVDETQTGLKIFRRSVLDRVLPDMRIYGYAFDLELLIRADRLGARMVGVPVVLAETARGASFRLSMAIELAFDTLRLLVWRLVDPGLRRTGRRLPSA